MRIRDINLRPIRMDNGVLAPVASSPANGFTLVNGINYAVPLPVDGLLSFVVSLIGFSAGLILTTAAVEDNLIPEGIIDDTSGKWLPYAPTSNSFEGAGWGFSTPNFTVAGGAVGGFSGRYQQMCQPNARLKLVVGATGGDVRIGFAGIG